MGDAKMIDPRLWASTPFRNRNAFLDLQGQIELFHSALADTVGRTLERTYPTYSLGSPSPDMKNTLTALQAQCSGAAVALGIPQPPDLESYDLTDAGDFASWTFQVAEFHRALQIAAGL